MSVGSIPVSSKGGATDNASVGLIEAPPCPGQQQQCASGGVGTPVCGHGVVCWGLCQRGNQS